MVNLNTLEAEKKKAQEEKEGNIVEAQIEVYENQNYEARNAYADAKAKRGKSRAKLPEEIPEERTYKEQLLQADQIKASFTSPDQQKERQEVDDYKAEIRTQQKAKETIQVLDRELPQLYKKAEQEVESVKESVYVTAKETATKTQNALIQSFDTQIESETKRRKDEIDAINLKYDSKKNPYPYKAGMKGKSFDNSSYINWSKGQSNARKQELETVRARTLKEDGWSPASVNRGGFIPMPTHPTSRKLYTGEALNQHAVKALKDTGLASVNIGNRWTRYQVEITRANQAVYDGGSLSAHASAVQAAKDAFDGLELKEQKRNSAQARAESVGQLQADQAHWDNVISTNQSVATANQKKLDSQGLNINVAELNKAGLSTIYNVGDLGETSISKAGGKQLTTVDMMKAGFLPKASTVGIDSTVTGYKRADSPVIGMKLDTSPKLSSNVVGLKLDSSPVITGSYNSNPILNQTGGSYTSKQTDSKDYQMNVKDYTASVYSSQRETERGNEQQKMFTNELRKGNIGVVPALLNPQTDNKYYGTGNPRNLKTFLAERGYDISNPNSIPDSVLMSPEKYTDARGATGDLRTKAPFFDGFNSSGAPTYSYPLASPEVQKTRLDAQQKKWDGFGISGVYEGITVPADKYYNSNSLLSEPVSQSVPSMLAPAPKQKQSSENITAVVKPPTWTFNNQSFTSKDKLDAYVKSRTDQAVGNTEANKLLNIKTTSNVTGSLNTEGYINATKYGESYNSNPILNKKVDSKPVSKPLIVESSKTSSSYSGDIFTVFNPITGKTKQFRKEEKAKGYVDKLNKDILSFEGLMPKYITRSSASSATFDQLSTKVSASGNPAVYQVAKDKMYDYTVLDSKGNELVFDKESESIAYIKNNPSRVFSGTGNPMWDAFNVVNAVESGEIPMPTSTMGKIEYYANVSNRPVVTLLATVANLGLSEDKQIPFRDVASGMAIGGTIEDVIQGDPLKGTGITSAWNYIKDDPLKFMVELPAEGVMAITGTKLIQGGTKVAGAGVGILANTGNKVIASNIPTVAKVPAIVMMGTGSAVKSGVQTAQVTVVKIQSRIGSGIWNATPEVIQSGLKKVDTGLHTMKNIETLDPNNRMSLTTRINYSINPFSRKLLTEGKVAGQVGGGSGSDLSNIASHADDWSVNSSPVDYTTASKGDIFNSAGQITTPNKDTLLKQVNRWNYDPNTNMKSGYDMNPDTGAIGTSSASSPLGSFSKAVEDTGISTRGIGRVPSPNASPSYYMMKPSGATPFATKISSEESTITKVLGKNPSGDLPLKASGAVPSPTIKRDSVITIIDKDKLFAENIYNENYSIVSLSKGKKGGDVKPVTVGTGVTTKGMSNVTQGKLKEDLTKANEKLLSSTKLNSMLSANEMKLNLAKAEDKVNSMLSANEMKLNLAKAEDKVSSTLSTKINRHTVDNMKVDLSRTKSSIDTKVGTVLSPNNVKLNLAKAEDKVNAVLSPNTIKLEVAQTKLIVEDKSKGMIVDVLNNPMADIPSNFRSGLGKIEQQVSSDVSQTKLVVGESITSAGNKVSGSIATAKLDLANKKLVIEYTSKGVAEDVMKIPANVRTGATQAGNKISGSVATARLDLISKKSVIEDTAKGKVVDLLNVSTPDIRTGVAQTKLVVGESITSAGNKVSGSIATARLDLVSKKLVIEDATKSAVVDVLNVSTPVRTGVAQTKLVVGESITSAGNKVGKIPFVIEDATKGAVVDLLNVSTPIRSGISKTNEALLSSTKLNYMLSANEMKLNLATMARDQHKIRFAIDQFRGGQSITARMAEARGQMSMTVSSHKQNISNQITKNWEIGYIRTSDSSIGKSGFIQAQGSEIVGDRVIPVSTRWISSRTPLNTSEKMIGRPITSGYLDADLRYVSGTRTALPDGRYYTPDGKPVLDYRYEGRMGDQFYHSIDNPLSFDGNVLAKTQGEIVTVPFGDRKIIEKNFQSITNTGKYQVNNQLVGDTLVPVEKTATIQRLSSISEEDAINFRMDKFGVSEDMAMKSPYGVQSITTSSQDLIEARTLLAKKKELFEANKGNYNSPTLRLVNEVKQENPRNINLKKQGYNIFPSGNAPFNAGTSKSTGSFTGKPTGATPNQQLVNPIRGESMTKIPKPEPIPKVPKPNIETGDYLKVKDIYKKASTTNASPFKYPKGVYTPAVGEIIYTSSILTPKGTVKTNVDSTTSSITGVQSKISTGLKQDTAQNLKTDSIQKLNTRLETGSKMKIKLDTGLKSAQIQRTAQANRIPLKMTTPQPRKKITPLPVPILQFGKKSTRGTSKRGKKAGFIGNVRLDNIMGMYKRKEITYGERKVTKLERQDARLTSGTSNRISMPASGLLATKKKKKKKSTSVFGGGKDEFKGFGSKKKGKKKSSLFG